jgi:predicted transcriptional regulator
MSEAAGDLRVLVAEVAAAYFSNSHVSASDIPTVVAQIASSLAAVGADPSKEGETPQEPASSPGRPTPAQIRKSITQDALISFEDGRQYKTLRRHLSTKGLSPEQYRQKWSLPADYPMVAPAYSAMRSEMAKSLGLGQKGAQARGRGRPRK